MLHFRQNTGRLISHALRNITRSGLAVLGGALLSGCAAFITESPASELALTPITVNASYREVPPHIERLRQTPTDIWGRIAHGLSWQHDGPLVTREREHFLAQPRLFEVLSERAQPALGWIVNEIETRGLPLELALVPVIESMLDPWAYSSQRAAGLWQISPATASHYGLERSWWYDARLDIPLATDFALSYLLELYGEFDQDWELALAAYNGGRGRVSRAITKAERAGRPTDYWSLDLPRETRRYVPRILAMSDLLRHADRYKLELPRIEWAPNMELVSTDGQIELARAAQLAGLNTGELRRLNPGHLRWATGPDSAGTLWLPEDRTAQFSRTLAQLPADQRVEWAHYRIAPGDSLIAIARRFDTQVQLIQAVNDLDGSLIRAGDELMIPKGGDWQASLQVAQRDWPPRRMPRKHRVRSGESLWTIARRYGVGLEKLTTWNNLDPDAYLQPGQTLRLSP